MKRTHSFAASPARRQKLRCPLRLSAVSLAVMLPLAAHSQAWITKGGLQLTLNATDNGGLEPSGQETADLITVLRPQLRIARRGANFGLSADLSADLVNYANGSQSDRVLPAARVEMDATAIERLLFVDASVDVRASESDPYRGSAEVAPDGSTELLSTYRVSPYVDYEITPRVSFVARVDETLTTSTQDASSDLKAHRALVRLSQKPLPLGASVELSRQALVYSDDSASDLTTEAVRLGVSYAFAGQFLVGAIAGHERTDFNADESSDGLYGVQFQWLPGPRTDLRARVEERFFGTGWDVAFRHRTPFLSFAAGLNREPVGYSAVSASALETDLNQYVDAILTTRYPDPTERQVQVDQIVNQRGLRTALPDASTTLADYAQLRTKANAAVVWLTPRNTVSISAYSQTLKRLTRADDSAAAPTSSQFDSRQNGGAAEYNRRLTPQMSLGALVQWSKVHGIGERDGDETSERSYRLSLSRNLSPRTSVAVGLQHRQLETNVAGLDSYTQTSAFAVMNYRF